MMEVCSHFASWLGNVLLSRFIAWKRTWTKILRRKKWRNNKGSQIKKIGKMKTDKKKTSVKVSKGKLVIRDKGDEAANDCSDSTRQDASNSPNQPLSTSSLPAVEDEALSRSSKTPSQDRREKVFKVRNQRRRCTKGRMKNKLHHITADLIQEIIQDEELVENTSIPEIKSDERKEQNVDLPLVEQGQDGKWLAHLHLDYEQKQILQSQQWLDDRIIDAAQTLLKSQFNPDGLQTCLLSQAQFEPVSGPAVQIHYDSKRHHWFTSCFRGNAVEVADSMKPPRLSLSARKQIKECYGSVLLNPLSAVQVLNVDQQPNSDDCGVYAIANAFEFLSNRDPTCRYSQKNMRGHLISCLEKGYFTAFPRCP